MRNKEGFIHPICMPKPPQHNLLLTTKFGKYEEDNKRKVTREYVGRDCKWSNGESVRIREDMNGGA